MKLSDLRQKFKKKSLFDQALTHRSWINENPGVRESNERLEFLGDAILEYIVSKEIFNKLPDKEEGYLTNLRANIVNTKSLAKLGDRMKLGEVMFVSKGEEGTGGRTNESLLADTVEAIIGAIFVDQGLGAAEEFVNELLVGDLQTWLAQELKDAKSLLQERVQSQGSPAPKYKIMSASGPDHDKEFEVAAMVNGEEFARGRGKSKSIAEQEAAAQALEKLDKKD